MEIPMYQPKPAIDFIPFMKLIEEKYGFKYRDMAGKYTWIAELKKRIDEKYGDKTWYNTKPVDMNENQKAAYEEYKQELKNEPPYQDVWHYMLDQFGEFNKSAINWLHITPWGKWVGDEWVLDEKQHPDYVQKVYDAILAEVKDNPAFDGEGVNFYIDW